MFFAVLGPNEEPKTFPKSDILKKTVIVTVWLSIGGLIQLNFLKPGKTLTAETFCHQIAKISQILLLFRSRLFDHSS